ncbi:aspartate ammonia-lyase [Robiginitalea sp.]|uniref:aspartate ammonia-lyase n=1 Tax=Robiginitalea sp. TaxID=1902411 RepID=UPI003C7574E6
MPIFGQETRKETDLLGEKEIPAEAYYGVQSVRALENFQISGLRTNHYPEFVKAWAMVKWAAASANRDAGIMPPDIYKPIEAACKAVIEGEYMDQFVVDLYQGGAGTSTNMNANEVLANIALEKAGHNKGDYSKIAPNDQLNMSQSTNDTYPTALKLGMLLSNDQLKSELKLLAKSFRTIGNTYLEIVKMGRTELQDAVPMTVGQEFHAYGAALEWEIANIERAQEALYVINMGATAIGTALNTPEGYAENCTNHLSSISGYEFSVANDLIAATWNLQSFVIYSSALKTLATTLSKISNDLIILSSGPRNGLFEINLPPRQPGSSIMPGKVNPVMPELMALVSYRVIGNDVTVSMAASDGDLQLNAYEPVVGISIFESQKILTNTMRAFREFCVDGITINEDTHRRNLETTIGIVTALNPVIGYKKSSELAKEARLSGKGILELIREQKLLTEAEIEKLLAPANMTGLDKSIYPKNKE